MGYVSSLKDLFDVHPKEANMLYPLKFPMVASKWKFQPFEWGVFILGHSFILGRVLIIFAPYVIFICMYDISYVYSWPWQIDSQYKIIYLYLLYHVFFRKETNSHHIPRSKKTSSWMCLILPRESHKHSCKQHKKGSKLLLMVQKTENLGCTKPCKSLGKTTINQPSTGLGVLPGFSGQAEPLKSAAQQLKRITNHQCHRGIEVLPSAWHDQLDSTPRAVEANG